MKLKLTGKRVLVYGMGMSGQSACKLLHEHGACVSTYDDEEKMSNYFANEKNPLEKEYDLIVVSPGIVVRGNPLITHFTMKKTPIISELDLGYIFSNGKMVGISGTNGKTTVTSLVGQICKLSDRETFVCGNIGLPLSAIADKTQKDSIIVCEVSNFQLELSSYFKADIACMLNLAPDHIDRHGSFEEYARVKRKLIKGKNQRVVLNFDDNGINKWSLTKKTTFFSKNLLNKGVFLKNNYIYYNKTKILPVSEIPLFGEKNIENVLASVAIAVNLKIKPNVIREAVASFKAPPHRLMYLGQYNGADVFDDSKATNISSTVCAIDSLGDRGLVILLGGLNKDFKFDDIFNKGWNFEGILCFGQCGEEIFNCAKRYGYNPQLFPSMKDATNYARENAKTGQKILLSPSCASFDEFASYAVRGEVFKEIMFGERLQIEMS